MRHRQLVGDLSVLKQRVTFGGVGLSRNRREFNYVPCNTGSLHL